MTSTSTSRTHRTTVQTVAGLRGSPRAWLFVIARHAALDELRRRRRHAALAADPPDAGAASPGLGSRRIAARRGRERVLDAL